MSWTTLLQTRDGDGPPPYNASLTANLACRLILGPVALLASWVPFRLLWRNGELAAAVMTATNAILVLFLVVNAAIWHSGDQSHWWLGYGWCDIQMYTQFAMTTVYGACVCAIMRRLAKQVGLTRVAGLSATERRNRVLVQSLIIFPVPLLQVILTFLVQAQRYTIMPVNGCGKAYDPDVIYLVFFVLPSPVFTAFACYYAYQTYHRFKDLRKTTRIALDSNNSTAASRSQRAKRKLYLMAMCILVPYAPVELLFLIFNVILGWPWMKPYDFKAIHYAANPAWSSITLFDYDSVSFAEMNMNWIPVITALVIFFFFGTGKDAINTYRKYLLAIGLGRLFPALRQEYDPDRRTVDGHPPSWGTQHSQQAQETAAVWHPPKGSAARTSCDLSCLSSTGTRSPEMQPVSPLSLLSSGDGPVTLSSPPYVPPRRPGIFNPGFKWSAPPQLPFVSTPSLLPSLLPRPEKALSAASSQTSSCDRLEAGTAERSVTPGMAWAHTPPKSAVSTRVWATKDAPLSTDKQPRERSSVTVVTDVSQVAEDSGAE